MCQLRGSAARAADAILEIGIRPVHPAWTVTAIAALIALAAVSLTIPIGQLVERSRVTGAAPPPARFSTAVEEAEGSRRLTVTGPPGRQVLVVAGDAPLAVVTLDGTGTGTVELLAGALPITALHVYPLSAERVPLTSTGPPWIATEAVATPEAPRPTAPPPPSRTPTPTATAQPPTATPAATRPIITPVAPTETAAPVPEDREPIPTRTPIVVQPLPLVRAPTPTPVPSVATPDEPPTPSPSAPSTTASAGLKAPPVLHLVPDAGPRIAITFDGGAHSAHAAELLDVLARLDLRATIFLTGQFIAREPALVRRAVLAGHEIGNHTWSHSHLTTYALNHRHDLAEGIDREWLIDELRRTEAAFQAVTGRPMAPLWRSPFGEENRQLRGWALAAGYLHVRWSTLEGASLDSHDWIADEHSPLFTDSRAMMARLLRFPQLEGGIVLMHLSTERDDPPWTELPRFVAELKARGIEPVAVTKLLRQSRIWRPWLERASAVERQRSTSRE